MARVRVISQCEALFVSSSPATGASQTITQLHRVQSIAHNNTVTRQDISQFGQLAPIAREVNETPVSTVDFSYYLVNLLNENNLGFVTDGSVSAITHLLDKTEDEKNYYILDVPEGNDAVGYASTGRVAYGIGNGFLASYSTEGAVNGFPTSTLRVEGLNMVAYASNAGTTPAINPVNGQRLAGSFTIPTASSGSPSGVPVLKHGDITLTVADSVGVDIASANIQRYTLGFQLNREALNRIGSRFAFSREMRFPIPVDLTIEAALAEIATGSWADLLCGTNEQNISITLRKPQCVGSGAVAASFSLIGATLDSQNFNATIGPSKTVTLKYSAVIGGPQDVRGMYMSGVLD